MSQTSDAVGADGELARDPAAAALYRRLLDHDLDRPGDAVPFSRKIAAQQGWTQPYARRAIDEYKRFVFLALQTDSVASPSRAVDQVWHLHLTYTREYWLEFCPQVLGRTLHHEPGRGGAAEDAKYRALYAQTRAQYRRWFGSDPPPDIWPDGTRRRTAWRRAGDWWQVAVGRIATIAPAVLAAVLLAGCALSGGLGVLDYDGPRFLRFYALLIGLYGAAHVASMLAWRLGDDSATWSLSPRLDAYQLAYLAGGPARFIHTVVLGLVHHGLAIFDARGMILPGAGNASAAPPMVAALHAVLGTGGTLAELTRRGRALADEVRAQLEARRLLVPRAQLRARRRGLVWLTAGLLLLGGAKLAVGMMRGRPVGFLVLLMIGTLMLGLPLFAIGAAQTRTRLGRRVLRDAAARLRRERRATAADANPQADALLALAALGAAGLADTAWAHYGQSVRAAERARRGGTDGGDGGSSCSSGGGGDGGGGCGGCGGGGD